MSENYALKLYVAGQTPKAVRAFSNLRKICEEHLEGRYTIEVIDLIENPQLGRGDQILALCAVGQDKAAREVATRLEQLSPRSIYATRLANSCVVDAEAAPGGEAIGDTAPVR